MNPKDLAGCLFLASSFFILGWVTSSLDASPDVPPAPHELSDSAPKLWLPVSLQEPCKKALKKVHEETTTEPECSAAVNQLTKPLNGACHGLGTLALQNIVCKDTVMSSEPVNPTVAGLPTSTPLPAPVNGAPRPPVAIVSYPVNQHLPWLSPYCVDTLKARRPETLEKKACTKELYKLSRAPDGGCRYDFALNFAADICTGKVEAASATEQARD